MKRFWVTFFYRSFNFRPSDNRLTPIFSNTLRRLDGFLTVLVFLLTIVPSSRADASATVVVPDKLCLPGEEIYIEATLYRGGFLGFLQGGVPGELLRFFDPQGNPLRALLTDPSGTARIRYKAGGPGRYPITVRLAENPRYSADPSTGNVFVQATGLSLLFVTVEDGLMPPGSTALLPKDPREEEARPGSVNTLSNVAPCHMLVYLTQWPKPSSHQIRSWLEEKGYPPGPIYFLDRPLLAGIVSEAPAPETDLLESLWKERSIPAHLVTGDVRLAEAAQAKGVRVLLLGEATSTSGTPRKQEGKDGENEHEDGIRSIQDWPAILTICRCEKQESS
jgi:hypothetical protein